MRTADLSVAIPGATSYRHGLSFELAIRATAGHRSPGQCGGFHSRAAPFTAHALTGPGRWFLRPEGSGGKEMPTSAAAGSGNRAGAINH